MDEDHALFWVLAESWLRRPGVTRSTMMGFPCLRVDGEFVACCDRRSGGLVVKLDEARVTALVADGLAEPFAPAGRRFRAWAEIPVEAADRWPAMLDEAVTAAGDRARSGR